MNSYKGDNKGVREEKDMKGGEGKGLGIYDIG